MQPSSTTYASASALPRGRWRREGEQRRLTQTRRNYKGTWLAERLLTLYGSGGATMNTREIVLGAAAVLCAASLTSAKIAPQGQGAPQPRSQQPRADPTKGPAMTLAGCLYRENSIPGRAANVAEKA